MSKLLIHPKDVPDIDLLKLQKAINHTEEVTELDCETIHVTQSESNEGDNSEKSIYCEETQDGEKVSNNNNLNHAQVSEKGKKSLGISIAVENSVVKEDEGIQKHVNEDDKRTTGCILESENSDKSLACYN